MFLYTTYNKSGKKPKRKHLINTANVATCQFTNIPDMHTSAPQNTALVCVYVSIFHTLAYSHLHALTHTYNVCARLFMYVCEFMKSKAEEMKQKINRHLHASDGDVDRMPKWTAYTHMDTYTYMLMKYSRMINEAMTIRLIHNWFEQNQAK